MTVTQMQVRSKIENLISHSLPHPVKIRGEISKTTELNKKLSYRKETVRLLRG